MKAKKKIKNIKELDLHNFSQIEAENLLYNFLADFREENFNQVRIITGYGLHSPAGFSIIKELTNKILKEKGIDYKYLEGQGVFEIILDK